MPGIFGLIDGNPASAISGVFSEMARRMKHHPWYLEHRHLDMPAGLAMGRISLGIVNTAEQPATNEDGSLWAVMEGELFDPEALRCALTAAGHDVRGHSHAELLVHGYESEGTSFFRRLNGTFAAAIWDGNNQRVVLATDRFGLKPLYYAAPRGKLIWASEIKAILADTNVPRGVSPRGVAQFLSFGHFLGEDTLFEAIQVLPAAGWLTYSPLQGRVDLGRYWHLEFGPGAPKASEAEVLDRIDDAFKHAVDRRVEGGQGLGISLSGGLDSRTIYAAIDHDRVPVTAVSIGIDGSLDHASAGQMARLVSRPHHQYHLNGGFLARFEEHLREMVYLTDGHYLCQCIVMPSLPVYRELGIEVLIRGHAGELMHMDKAYNFSLDHKAFSLRDGAELEDWLFDRLRAYMSGATLNSLLAAHDGRAIEELARVSLRSCLEESAGADRLIHRVWHLFINQRMRRETALSLVEFGSLMETRLPYMDNELVDVLLAIPPEWKLSERIQSHILRRRMPAFLNVVNTNTGARVGADRLERLFAETRLKVLSKLRIRGYQPYERMGLWLRRELRPLVEQLLLSERCLDRGVLNPQVIRTVVEQHLGNQQNHTFLILALMIFETGQREFVDARG